MTIHKCQGLSLDCAVVDLSEKVFSAGTACVALSRVRSLSCLHLSAFDPSSIIASPSYIREVNRLRENFRKDLPPYNIPKVRARKRKFTSEIDVPKARKVVKLATKTVVIKASKEVNVSEPPAFDGGYKFPHDRRDYQPRDEGVWPFSYHPVN